ncbi:ABC transporter ATP-binding protein/permease [Mesorhizobium sp. RMAD-H1]|uniref:ABC transporter ATP-binding protein/permease n=1 Tax=Mesorhizobium sp. RMAD-H1 TaxID=2587065 RepID=UPI00179F4B95|nr:ABC transporter ATP-binding protein/permease [Mesorhizobium sp. RMAD-H1]MBB2971186.1 putative ATP-binding cassette transporter [Mesorhizobium sp. RMAD-H1]
MALKTSRGASGRGPEQGAEKEARARLFRIRSAGGTDILSQGSMMVGAFWTSPVRNALIVTGGSIFLLIAAIAYGQLYLNRWNVPFYDALARRDFPAFLHQLLIFLGIAGSLLVLNVTQTWLNQMFKLKLREGLAGDLIGQWMQPGRAFRLANAGEIGVNPDQRLHEDARHLAEMTADLGIGLLQASILLISFVGVLWALSSGFVFHVWGYSFAIPGYMVWAAIFYAASASWLTWIVGRRLVTINADRYAREADLRFSLMRVNEHIDAIALARGEADEKRRLDLDLGAVLIAIRRIVLALTNLTWVTAGYGWFTIVAPILVAAPVYFSGGLTFGGLMMAVGAFTQVHTSLRWFVDNFGAIADWRATLLRVASFRQAVLQMDELSALDRRIAIEENEESRMTIDGLEIVSPEGSMKLRETHVEIGEGERVLIVGAPGAGKTLLFRALAGLWSWGAGRIGLPKGSDVVYMPRTPYFPPSSLRGALAYPLDASRFSEDELQAALQRGGLDRLASSLDRVARWDRVLSEDEQQCLAFARLSLINPRWIVVDEALDGMEEEALERVLDILRNYLQEATVIHIGRRKTHDHVFSRVLHLEKNEAGEKLELPAQKYG